MIEYLKSYFFLLKQFKKQKKIQYNLYKAKKHALLALAYWKKCNEKCDLHFQIENSSIYVRLGKGFNTNEY